MLCTRIIHKLKQSDKGVGIAAYAFRTGGTCQVTVSNANTANNTEIVLSIGKVIDFYGINHLNKKRFEEAKQILLEDFNYTYSFDVVEGSAYINITIYDYGFYYVYFLPSVSNFSGQVEFIGRNPDSYLDYWMSPVVGYVKISILQAQVLLAIWVGFLAAYRLKITSETVMFTLFLVSLITYNSIYDAEMTHFNKSDDWTPLSIARASLQLYELFFFLLFLPLSQVINYLPKKRKKCVYITHIIVCFAATVSKVLAETIGYFLVQSICLSVGCFLVFALWIYYAIRTECNKLTCILYTIVGVYLIQSYFATILLSCHFNHWATKILQDSSLVLAIMFYIVVYYHHYVKDVEIEQENEDKSDFEDDDDLKYIPEI